jgi:3-hydroxyisobutyrate dehydrogenase-like beta-hydroxyacid dehydrogenase
MSVTRGIWPVRGVPMVFMSDGEAQFASDVFDTDREIQATDVMEQSSGQSWIGSDRMRRALIEDYAPRAHMPLLAKDSKLALQMAQSVGFINPVGERAAQAFEKALQAGMSELDDAALIRLYQS